MTPPYPRIHVVINPGAGKGHPVLNLLNDVCKAHGVEWDISLTRQYGDATEQARAALARGVDLVVGCGGDGTQHEIANAVLGAGKAMGVLPGGTGNGFATEMGIPKDFGEAVKVLCTSQNVRRVDAMQIGEQYCIQRMYAGIEPEQQVSRAQKNKYGIMAYALLSRQQMKEVTEAAITLTIDGKKIETLGYKCYVVNSGMGGAGVSIDADFRVDDGLLDVFVLSHDRRSVEAAADRFLRIHNSTARFDYWRGQEIMVESEPSKAIWTDGEIFGRTPVTVKVLPGALPIIVP
jgi:diacylglycerol kinase (ATP)